MGLPIQQAPKHRCKLSDGTEVTFRPFLVKEQKFLLIAKESTNAVEILDAVKSLVTSVTNGKVDSDKLPIFDLEYLFLQMRAKSVGETVSVNLYCREQGCDGTGRAEVDLTQVKVQKPEEEVDNTIALTDTLGVTLRYPTTKQLANVDTFKDEGDKLVHLLKFGIESVYDEETVYTADDISDTDLVEFVESLTLEQVDKLNEFFETVPVLAHDVDYKCDTCGTEQTTKLKGLQSFF